jgi:hypothetical protein
MWLSMMGIGVACASEGHGIAAAVAATPMKARREIE